MATWPRWTRASSSADSARTAPDWRRGRGGVDSAQIGFDVGAKSVSHEHTFDVNTNDWDVLERSLLALSEGVAGRLRKDGLLCATVAVKIRDSNFVTITRQRSLKDPTDLTDVIWRTAVGLTRKEVHGMTVRLLGVAATGLTDRQQLALFATTDERRRRVVEAEDSMCHAVPAFSKTLTACSSSSLTVCPIPG